MTRINSLAVCTLYAGMKLGPMFVPVPVPVPVSVSFVSRHPESDAPASDHEPVAPAPAPRAPQPTDAAPPAPAGNVCDQMALGGRCCGGLFFPLS